MEHLADWTVVVVSSQEKILKRAAQRGIAGELARKILSTQWALKKKARLADLLIQNNGTLTRL
jgi:dephospho-CoA kinase